jgi:hypothetical protein
MTDDASNAKAAMPLLGPNVTAPECGVAPLCARSLSPKLAALHMRHEATLGLRKYWIGVGKFR